MDVYFVPGSHEDDIHMAENVKGLKTTLSIGFLEMTEVFESNSSSNSGSNNSSYY